MKPIFEICSRLLRRSSRYLNHSKASHLRCYCNTVNNCDQPEGSSPKSTEKLQELLDDAAQGPGLGDEVSHEDEWRTSPYPPGAVINPRQSQSAKSLRPNVDPSDTSIILFPGYGSQHVGMGRELLKYPAARDIFDASSAILKMDVLKMMLNGPKRTLDRIKYADPLIFICSLAALEKLKEERPWAIESCIATAGFSVGEITALTFAGVFSFVDGLKLVNTRAHAIELACDMERGGMAIVHYNASSKLREAMAKAKEWCSDRGINKPECVIATYLNPNMKIIAGHTEALKYIECNKDFYKIDAIFKLPTRGAFHTNLMLPAADRIQKKLQKLELNEPMITVHTNLTGGYYEDVKHIVRSLVKQIYRPIKWEQMLHILYEREPTCPFPQTVICGPLNPLGDYLKQALSFIKSHSREFRLKLVLPIDNVHGAVHTKLMEPAADVLKELLSSIELSEPSARVYSNVTAKTYSNLDNVRKILPNQVCKPLMWEQMIHKMFDRKATVNVPSVFTCGPKSPNLKYTLAKVNMEASRNCIFVF